MNDQHLYQVEVRHSNGDVPRSQALVMRTTLNILVPKEMIGSALTKARKFLSQNKDRYPDAIIKGIEYAGAVDELEGE